ncbi:MAG: hypothetical protein JNG89_07715 [Planctomycetaceae bacterium]|nr:hypothetical protein [Planctomycetaceae bacterium]
MENAQYHALYAALDANFTEGWRGKLRTCGYGGFDENRQNDAASPPMYLGAYRNPDLTTPGAYAVTRFDPGSEELEAESTHPNSWREYSISFLPSATYNGAQNGSHAVVDPESFAGLMSHVAWRLQSPGKEVRLTYWDNAFTLPQHLIFAQKTNGRELKPVCVDALTSIGRTDLLTLTVEDYELETLRALDRIHDNPVINRYWREGTTATLGSSLNSDTSVQVYATQTTIPGVEQTLVCVYSPCDLNGEIPLGAYKVPAKRLGYWLTPELQEVR